MEDIIKFRIFLAFPLAGLLIPDLGLFLTGAPISAIPVTHIIIAATLMICIAVLTVGIALHTRKHGVPNDNTENSPLFDL